MAAGAATLLAYSGLLAVSLRQGSLAGVEWTSSAAAHLRPYKTVAAERGAVVVHASAQALTWTVALTSVPLVMLSLLWSARQDQQIYMRLAVGLLLSGTAGLGIFSVGRGEQVRAGSLLGDYLASPDVRAGGYVLVALAVFATTSRSGPRAAVLLMALLATMTGASAGGDLRLAVLTSLVAPLLAWYAAGHLSYEKGTQARGSVRASHKGSEPSPLRQAG